MDSLLFALNVVLPIVLMMAVGYWLKTRGLMNTALVKQLNRLVFQLFLPAMLFLNIYKMETLSDMDPGFVVYVVIMVLTIFLLAAPAVMAVTKEESRRGPLLQGIFRSNYALVGTPLAQSLFGDEGVAAAALLSAVIVPLFNTLAVVALSVFQKKGGKTDVKKILSDIAKNPLIHGVLLGLLVLLVRALFVRWGVDFRLSQIKPVYKVIEYLSGLGTPVALLVLGAQFEFSAAAQLKKEVIFGTFSRCALVPILGIGTAYLLFRDTFSGAAFAAFVAVFATPVAVSSVPMSQEMGCDSQLAGQLVVWTTLFSAFSVFFCSFLLRLAGIFG